MGATWPSHTDENLAHWMALLAIRTGHSCQRYRPVAHTCPAGSSSHRLGTFGGDHSGDINNFLRHPRKFALELGGVRHESPTQNF